MTRVLRYPRMSACACIAVMLCAVGRDICVSASLTGWANVLLVATVVLLLLALTLMSCRLFIDDLGVGVGVLLRVRRTAWEDIASFGLLYCNSRRRYFYGMYHGATDFINLLHHAPHCGPWGFVVPASNKLLRAVCLHCPFPVDLSSLPVHKREGKLRTQWQHAAIYTAMMLPTAALCFVFGMLTLMQAAAQPRLDGSCVLTLCAIALLFGGVTLLYRLFGTLSTCPAFSTLGVCAGRRLYLPWSDVRFGYVHRIAQMSGLFLLSQPLDVMHRRSAPPILCLSMPDTQTMLLSYLMYCPHASKGMEI